MRAAHHLVMHTSPVHITSTPFVHTEYWDAPRGGVVYGGLTSTFLVIRCAHQQYTIPAFVQQQQLSRQATPQPPPDCTTPLTCTQITAHLVDGYNATSSSNAVDGDPVPVPHFGAALQVEEFHALADRVRTAGVGFAIEPHLRFQGVPLLMMICTDMQKLCRLPHSLQITHVDGWTRLTLCSIDDPHKITAQQQNHAAH